MTHSTCCKADDNEYPLDFDVLDETAYKRYINNDVKAQIITFPYPKEVTIYE